MQNRFRRFGFAVVAALAAALLAPVSGLAAPQALALIATNGAVALNCAGDECGAEFSSFCLQQNRTSPARGTAFRLIGGGTVAVTGTTPDGGTVTLNSKSFLKFQSLRTHVAVRIAVPRSIMLRYGLQSVSVQIGENVTLAPVPIQADGNPQDAGGLATASGPLRAIGTRYVDSNGARMAAARLTNRLINNIDVQTPPRDGGGQTLWRRAIGDTAAILARAHSMARGALDFCQFALHRRIVVGIKGCLQERHDKFISYLNGAYWKATGAGS